MIKHPFYEIEIKTSGCAVELLVNEVLSFSNYKDGGLAVSWPINEMILKSGDQLFSVTAIRYGSEEIINPKAMISIKVFVRDALDTTILRELVKEYPLLTFEDKKVPYYTYNNLFYAEVPYELEGWQNSINIIKENKKALLEELEIWNNKFLNIFTNKKEKEYMKITKSRFEEISQAFYLDERSKEISKSRMFSSIHSSINKVPIEKYELGFFGKGRLVGVKLPGEPFGFKYKSLEKEKPHFTELVLFHRKNRGQSLKIIR